MWILLKIHPTTIRESEPTICSVPVTPLHGRDRPRYQSVKVDGMSLYFCISAVLGRCRSPIRALTRVRGVFATLKRSRVGGRHSAPLAEWIAESRDREVDLAEAPIPCGGTTKICVVRQHMIVSWRCQARFFGPGIADLAPGGDADAVRLLSKRQIVEYQFIFSM